MCEISHIFIAESATAAVLQTKQKGMRFESTRRIVHKQLQEFDLKLNCATTVNRSRN